MGERPGVKIVADLANKSAVRAELQQLGGGCSVGRTRRVAAGKDENVSLGVHRHARGLAQIKVRRQLYEIGNGLVADLGRRLGQKRSAEQKTQGQQGISH